MATWDTIDRYVVISTDTHAGADIGDYKPYLPTGSARRLRRVGQDLRQPVRRPDHRDRQPKLGQRSADRRHGCRRGGRRGVAAQHRSAVLPDHPQHHHQPAPHPRRVREALGGRASAQPLADRLLFAGPDPPPRADPDLPQRHRSWRWTRSVGAQSTTASAGCWFRRSRRATRMSLRSSTPATNRSGRSAKNWTSRWCSTRVPAAPRCRWTSRRRTRCWSPRWRCGPTEPSDI